MDLEIKNDKERFKCRVNGVLINDDKMLALQMCNNGFFCCPGGHIELGEDSKTAIIREFKEETGLDVHVEKLLCIIENFYFGWKQDNCHEISFYYLLKANDLKDKSENFKLIEYDMGRELQMDFRWFKLDEIGDVEFKPLQLKNKLKNHNFNFEHFITRQ